MDRLSALELFVAAADSQSFTAAARARGCSPTAASRAIGGLETELGVALFRRSTRQVSLTDEGAAYRDKVRPLLAELRAAGRTLGDGGKLVQGALYITAPTMFGRLHVLPVLAGLLARHAGLTASIMLIDRNVRLIEEGIDVAVRIGALADSTLKAVRIGAVHPVIVASPAYLARCGIPREPGELARHHLIAATGPRAGVAWSFGRVDHAASPRLTVTTVDAAVSAAEAGIGLASLLSYQVAGALAAGRLVEVLGDSRRPALPVHLVFDGRRHGPASRSLFIEAMTLAARRSLGGAEGPATAG